MRNLKKITLVTSIFCLTLLLSGCMPDSLDKWEETAPPEKKIHVPNTAAGEIPDGTIAPSGITFASSVVFTTLDGAQSSLTPTIDNGVTVVFTLAVLSGEESELPSDVSFNSATGVLSLPSATSISKYEKTTLRLTATNSIGSVYTDFEFSVIDPPTNLAYTPSAMYTPNTAATSGTPAGTYIVSTGDSVASFTPAGSGGPSSVSPTWLGSSKSNFTFAATPALPDGMSLDADTGVISGAPSLTLDSTPGYEHGTPHIYNIRMTNDDYPAGSSANGFTDSSLYIQTMIPPQSLYYDQPHGARLVFKISGYTGAGTLAAGTPVVNQNEKLAVIQYYNGSDTIYVDIDNNSTTFNDDTTVFKKHDKLDIGTTYSTEKTRITEIKRIFAVVTGTPSANISVTPAAEFAGTNVTFSISPNFPTDPITGTPSMQIDSSTGVISGYETTSRSATEYTITATNILGGTGHTANISVLSSLGSINYSKFIVLTMDDVSPFTLNGWVSSPAVAPLTTEAKGTVVKIDTTNKKLFVKIHQGQFAKDGYVDIFSPYRSAMAVIQSADYYSAVVTSTPSVFNYGDEIEIQETPATKGTVSHVDTSNSQIYVALNGVISTVQNLNNTTTGTPGYDVVEVDSHMVKLTSSSCFTNFNTDGADITSNATTPATGFIKHWGDANTLTDVEVINNSFAKIDSVKPDNPYNKVINASGVTACAITQVASSNLFAFSLHEPLSIYGRMSSDSETIYTISPTLPAGLTFDTSTGQIYGQPTEPITKTLYTVSAVNPVDSESTTFYLQIDDGIMLKNKETEVDSYILHRVNNQSLQRNSCRLTQTQIESGINDILCRLETGENELYTDGISFEFDVGAGICSSVRFVPYSFFYKQYNPSTTSRVLSTYTATSECTLNPCKTVYGGGDQTCSNLEAITTPSVCLSPTECDDGRYTLRTYNYELGATSTPNTAGADGNCYATPFDTTVSCTGSKYNCVKGPGVELNPSNHLTGQDIDATGGLSSSSTTNTWSYTAGGVSNLSLANFVNSNGAAASNGYEYYSDNWSDFGLLPSLTPTYMASSYDSPFKNANPFYTWLCLDGAGDPIARIRLQVREWDRTFDATSTYQINRVSPTPTPGYYMDAGLTQIMGSYYNNYQDWDVNASEIAPFPGSTPVHFDVATPASYSVPTVGTPQNFPEIYY